MIRLLIADDETSACDDMIRCIDWDKYGIEIIGVAADGLEAYQMISEHHPDIVLIDIEMPGMNGIDVIKKVNDEIPHHPSFIIVSGYDDFSYAQQAVSLDVDQYLLKPFLPSHLLSAIHRSVEKLEIVKLKEVPPFFWGFSKLHLGDNAQPNFNYPAKEERQTIKAIRAGSPEDINEALSAFWQKASTNSLNRNDLLFSGFLLSISIIHLLFDYGISQFPKLSPSPDLFQACTERNCFLYLRQLSHAVAEQLRIERSGLTAPALRAAAYIAEHYQEDLNLDSVAQAIHVSPSYLSTCFSQSIGIGFVEYLHHTRIEHAKELLHSTNLKIYQIAELVGYSDSKYFAQIFKKFTQRTPGEYRNL